MSCNYGTPKLFFFFFTSSQVIHTGENPVLIRHNGSPEQNISSLCPSGIPYNSFVPRTILRILLYIFHILQRIINVMPWLCCTDAFHSFFRLCLPSCQTSEHISLINIGRWLQREVASVTFAVSSVYFFMCCLIHVFFFCVCVIMCCCVASLPAVYVCVTWHVYFQIMHLLWKKHVSGPLVCNATNHRAAAPH